MKKLVLALVFLASSTQAFAHTAECVLTLNETGERQTVPLTFSPSPSYVDVWESFGRMNLAGRKGIVQVWGRLERPYMKLTVGGKRSTTSYVGRRLDHEGISMECRRNND